MKPRPSRTVETKFAPRPQGADLLPEGGVRHRLWAPGANRLEVTVFGETEEADKARTLPMEREPGPDGFFSVTDPIGRAGDRYKYRIDDELLPDPFSRWQAGDPADSSVVIDPRAYRWNISEWPVTPLAEAVLYELHVGAFSLDGTFRGAIERLDFLVELGVTTIELMPVAAFPGNRNWGYDGVVLFSPDSSYGHPDDLRALIDAAHARGLNVLLDLVYNHFGPDGNFLTRFSPYYFDPHIKTPWGDAVNFSGEHAQHVRAVFLSNVAYWLDEFRCDGFRLDATHTIVDDSTPHILAEIARLVHARKALVIAEDERNLASLALPPAKGGTGLDGLWADDFHHTVRVALTGQREGYFANYTGTGEELATTLQQGWLFTGQVAPTTGKPRGTPTDGLRLEQFLHCIANHDQVGNQAFGERLNHLVSPAAYRAASALLCLTPGTPLLFMGQEWASSSPFLYFTNHHNELGKRITEGRRREFKEFVEALREKCRAEEIPDPQEEITFLQSKLQWDEISRPKHARVLLLYRELLKLRREIPDVFQKVRENCRVACLEGGVVGVRFQNTRHSGLLLLLDLKGGHEWELDDDPFADLPAGWAWQSFFSTNETRFGGDGSSPLDRPTTRFVFNQPEAILLKPIRLS